MRVRFAARLSTGAWLLLAPATLLAQTRGEPMALYTSAGGDLEGYLRALQIAGRAPLYPWSIRAFSQQEIARLASDTAAHPWSRQFGFGRGVGKRHIGFAPAELTIVWNSTFPHGGNDGAVWSGRGLTASLGTGVIGRLQALTFAFAPVGFYASNTAFDLAATGSGGPLAFADPQYPTTIDLPQRFGDGTYSRWDPGQSYLRFDAGGVAVGISIANEWWGPAHRYPYLLGNNAPGFPHAFVGTSRPVSLYLARAHGRVLWGKLEQSDYSAVSGSRRFVDNTEPGRTRWGSGLIVLLEPRGATGLEIGISRFFHSGIPQDGVGADQWKKPFERLLEASLPLGRDPIVAVDNQLFSLFARWTFPRAALEAYAEYGREDRNRDKRDALMEPDHIRSYTLGLAKVLFRGPERMHVLRGELINAQFPHLVRHRGQSATYIHDVFRQGHTHRGQLLGAPTGISGAGSILSWETFTPRGKWVFSWERILRRERGSFYATGIRDQNASDVVHELAMARTRFTRWGELNTAAGVAREFNRNFEDDAWNLQLKLGAKRRF